MEIESFWKGIKPFCKTEKGKNGKIGYGEWKRKGKEQPSLHYYPNHRRKSYRQIRKYGFDLSEIWSLDCTIMRWLSDNVGGFFTVCGIHDDWDSIDLEGNPYEFWTHHKDKDWLEKTKMYGNTRTESFQKHLQDFLDNPPSKEIYDNFLIFVIPRLRQLANNTCGWPSDDNFPEFKDWTNEINNMADKFEQQTYSPYFISHFFSLWD